MHSAGVDLNVGAVFEALELAVADPGDAVGDGEHLRVVRRGDDGDAVLLLHPLEQLDALSL